MTLIYTVVTGGRVFQASDRLLTIAGSGEPHDAAANKTIVVHGQSFTAVVSYTGVAYLRGLPTDEYLVRELIGHTSTSRLSAFTGWVVPPRFHMQYVLSKLAEAIDRAFAAQPALRAHALELSVGGLQRTAGNGVRHVSASVLRRGAKPTVVSFHRAHPDSRNTFQLVAAGAVDLKETTELRARLRNERRSDSFAQLLVDSIVNVSQRERSVGRDVMLVQIKSGFEVVIEYRPLIESTSPFHRLRPPRLAYTPALVTPAWARSASLAYARDGDLTWYETDGFTFTVSGPAIASQLPSMEDEGDVWRVMHASSTQPREPAPRRTLPNSGEPSQ